MLDLPSKLEKILLIKACCFILLFKVFVIKSISVTLTSKIWSVWSLHSAVCTCISSSPRRHHQNTSSCSEVSEASHTVSFCWRPPQVMHCTVTVVGPQEAAALSVSGQLNLVVHLLQNSLVQLDLCVRDQVSTRQNHGPLMARGRLSPDLDLRRQREKVLVLNLHPQPPGGTDWVQMFLDLGPTMQTDPGTVDPSSNVSFQ